MITSIKIANYKCFGSDAQGFDDIRPINILIGRNNAGKSALLDLVELACVENHKFPLAVYHASHAPTIYYQVPLAEDCLRPVFPENTSAGGIPGKNHWEYASNFVGVPFAWKVEKGARSLISIGDPANDKLPGLERVSNAEQYIAKLLKRVQPPLSGRTVKRIAAERDIQPETDHGPAPIAPNGTYVTNAIQLFVNKAAYQSEIIEKRFLSKLNDITSPTLFFARIVPQQHDDNKWELFLEERHKGRIPLSASGSGLKTILILLAHLELDPLLDNKDPDKYVFCIEEPENNMHPAQLRKLLSYLESDARETGRLFFITTHSSVAIDVFSTSPEAQILHLLHDGTSARVETVSTYLHSRNILDDLDVRASDLLQSNGIIWVEGPSDRTYLNRWLAIHSEGTLREGLHYQCMYYAGSLLVHLDAAEPQEASEFVSILRMNRNVALLADSDKSCATDEIGETKQRLLDEVQSVEGLAWVTAGRTIENYIPSSLLANTLELQHEQLRTLDDQFTSVFAAIDSAKPGLGQRWSTRKPVLAEMLAQQLQQKEELSMFDLPDKLDSLCALIKRWNGMQD